MSKREDKVFMSCSVRLVFNHGLIGVVGFTVVMVIA